MDYFTDKLSSSVFAHLKEWALGTANQWLHDLVGGYLENITMPGAIALGVAALAAVLLLGALTVRVVKLLTSVRGMFISAGVLAAALACVWFTLPKSKLPFEETAHQETGEEAPSPFEPFDVLEEIAPDGFGMPMPSLVSAPPAPLMFPATTMPHIEPPIILPATSHAAAPSHPPTKSGNSGHTATASTHSPVSAPSSRAVHATSAPSVSVSTPAPSKAKPASVSTARASTAAQTKATSRQPTVSQSPTLFGQPYHAQTNHAQANHAQFVQNQAAEAHRAQLRAHNQAVLGQMDMMMNNYMHHMSNGGGGMQMHPDFAPMHGGHMGGGHMSGGFHPGVHGGHH